jgi:hypothetical protein
MGLLLLCGACTYPERIDYQVLQNKVRSFLSLHTYEMVYKDVEYYGHHERLLGMFNTVDKRLLFSVQIRVRAGINLHSSTQAAAALRIEPIDTGNSGELAVRVTLPEASILLVDADDTSIVEYFAYNYGAAITRRDWEERLNDARRRVQADALGRGILVRAGENARNLISNFLQVAGIQRVEFASSPGLEIPFDAKGGD